MRYTRRQQKNSEAMLAQAHERWAEQERERNAVQAEEAHQTHLLKKARRVDDEFAQSRRADRRRFEEERDRPPQESDSDPEASLETILRNAPREDRLWDAPSDADAPERDDPGFLWDITPLERRPDASEPPPRGRSDHDPRAGSEREQAARDAWNDHVEDLQRQQEHARQRREAEAAARRASQASKRGAMRAARQAAATAMAHSLARAEALTGDHGSITLAELFSTAPRPRPGSAPA
ncbi:MAG: hypothetical protein K0S37_670 [Microbacterium sp.]|nr:hypothetical protein [Microbacterium sp.]